MACQYPGLFLMNLGLMCHVLYRPLCFCCFRFNSIHKITDKSLAGLRKLELLMVHGNDIHSLPDGVFRDLTSLQVHRLNTP